MSQSTVAMRYRSLGTSGLKVSEICLGTMTFGGPTEEGEAQRIADHAVEAGVNFIDTANTYEKGRSEEVVGKVIRAKRNHWVLATKLAQPMGSGPNDRGLSRRNIVGATEASLKRLGTDHIDISYIHRVDPTVPWTEVARSFGDLIQAGKLRYWGLSNVRAWHIPVIATACRDVGAPPPVVLQPYYNLLNRMPEVEVLPVTETTDHIEIPELDLRVDVYRSSGPGGQSVNTTDSAVRLTHIPTGIVVTCQNEKSQLQNKVSAMRVLQAKLLERKRLEERAEMDALKGDGGSSWGNQMRSYVLHPYQMVKDLRTEYEVGNPAAVLDGDIDGFLEAGIRWRNRRDDDD
jgi:diketogulonate reductase-like aldo/keto reductase